MRKIYMILFLTLWVTLGGCSSYIVSSSQVMEVQPGMSRQNVEKILGKPDFRRFDENSEEWEFDRLSSMLYGTSKRIIVHFVDGAVVSMDTFDGDFCLPSAPPAMMPTPVFVGSSSSVYPRAMSPADFNRFFSDYKNEPFESGRAKMLDELGTYLGFTCRQCRKIVELYTFDSEKKNMVKKLYPKIDDKDNFYILTDIFTFEMDKRELRDFAESFRRR